MTRPARIPGILALIGATALFAASESRACDSQRANEVYLGARAEVAALPARDRERLAQEWAGLEAEQKFLWALAGEIDEACRQGELSPEVVPYNARVLAWQEWLRKFLKRMHNPSDSPSGKPEPEPAPLTEAGTNEIEFPGSGAKAKTPPAPPRPLPSSMPLTPNTLL